MKTDEKMLEKNEKWDVRFKRNAWLFLLSYIIAGGATGILNDSYMSYLGIVSPDLIKGLNLYGAITSLIIAVIVIYIRRCGYKKIIIGAGGIGALFLLGTVFIKNPSIIAICYTIGIVGVAIFDWVYPLLLTSYVPKEKRVKFFSLTMGANLLAQSIIMFFNGKWVLNVFASLSGISYDKAAKLSQTPDKLSGTLLANYTNAFKYIIMIAIILCFVAVLVTFFLKEKKSDYQETPEEIAEDKKARKIDFSILKSKTILLWVLYTSLISAGALLIIPYLPIYLNEFLHIDRGNVSTIMTLSSLAMFVGYAFSPWIEKKMGAITSNALATTIVIPLMLLIANGTIFGGQIVLFMSIIVFLRSGIVNATNPIQQSLQISLVPKDVQPAFNSFMILAGVVVQIIVGLFTKYFLFTLPNGYSIAYYITSAFYLIASIMLYVVFNKKYNWAMQNREE